MLLSSSDNQTVKEITTVYCVLTIVAFSILIPGLVLSGRYLLLGSLNVLPVFYIITFLEICKWIYAQFKYFKEISSIPKVDTRPIKFLLHLLQNLNLLELIHTSSTILASIIVFFVVAVLFGATLLDRQEETFMFSLLVTILTIFPLCLNLGSNSVPQLISGRKPANMLHHLLNRNVKSTLIGAWFGAAVIPLDWDRPWQLWPVPCSTGALLGYFLSHSIMLIITQFSNNIKGIKVPRKKH